MRVLYVNHTALVSGAERSLLTLLNGLPHDVQPVLACPPGPLADMAEAVGVPVRHIPGTAGSLRLHPVHTPRAAVELGRSALAVRTAARQTRADLVHANTIRADLIAIAAARLGAPPVVAHVRDRLPPGAVSNITLRLIARGARVVIANSEYTASQIPSSRRNVRVIPNGVDLKHFDPDAFDGSAERERLGIGHSAAVLAVIGQLTPWKGQDLAIRVAGELARSHPGLRLLIVGSAKFTAAATRHDNRGFEADLRRLVADLGVEETVLFLGEREDVPALLAATDLLLVPSWEEPFGRSVAEAMAMGVPVIATDVGGPAEMIRPGADGLLLPPSRPAPWIAAVTELIDDPARRCEMKEHGRKEALARFSVEKHVSEVLWAYAVTEQ